QAASVFGDASLGIFSAILTFLILVGSEIIPKTLGATYWKGLTPFVTRVLPPMIISLWPLVKMSEWLAKLLSSGKKGHAVSREEITALARIGEEAGIVGEDESRIVKNLFRFDEITVEDIMTPRTVMFALDETQTVEDVIAAHETIRFSRIPIYKGAVDDVQGLVLKNDILMCAVRGDASTPLSELKRPISRVPEDVHLKDLFERLLDHNNHLSLVTDPYGGTAGVVSLEDVVETLLGLEIVDEADTAQDLQALARQKWKERASRLGLLTEETEQSSA
ncbi:MAG: CNNM domain-containing protein, partial [Pseudomonadota bacterium]